MLKNTPGNMVRAVVEACADCDTCRYLMEDTPCMVFPELYRLYDKEAEKRVSISQGELRNLVDLCNFCALCPCPNVRSDLMKANSREKLNGKFGSVAAHTVYYPPCHLREQKIGEPWPELLSLVPGISLEKIDGSFHCCGIAGIMGFKRDFHEVSVKMGSRLMEKIKAIRPERLLTDCLSCRLQFNQLTTYKVFHPVEILKERR